MKSRSFAAMRETTLLVLLACSAVGRAQSSALDSLLRILPGQHGAQRVRTLGEVQWELGFSDPQKALAYGAEAMRLAEGLKDSAVIAQAANDMVITEYRLGHQRVAVALNMRALRIRAALSDSMGMAASHSKIAVAWTDLMEFDSALVHSYAAVRLYERLGDAMHTAIVRGNIGHLYQQMEDLPAAERIIRESVAALRDKGNDYALAAAYGQLMQVLEQRGRLAEALEAGGQAAVLYERIGSAMDLASISNELGQISRKRGDDAAGLGHYHKAMQLGEAAGDLVGVATYSLNLGNVMSDLGRWSEALRHYERSVALSRAGGYEDQRMTGLKGWATALERTGDLRGALARQQELIDLRDSVYKADRLNALSDMQVKYETERTERELLEERERGLERENRIVRQRLFIALAIGAALLIALTAWLLATRQRARLKAERDAAIIAERERGLKAWSNRPTPSASASRRSCTMAWGSCSPACACAWMPQRTRRPDWRSCWCWPMMPVARCAASPTA
jgi:tetratricopeptide (TPR) repeat protein